jgi:hypothetical protein
MEYVIIGLLIVILILVVVDLMKSTNESNITERLGKMESNMIKELGEFKSNLKDEINDNFNGFENSISCITQSNITGNIIVTCWDGNTYLLNPPNIDFYLK